MNVIYFTAGEGLFDDEIRRQSLRIAEVLSAVQQAQASHREWDLMTSLILDDQFDRLPGDRQKELIKVIQWGLFERFCRQRIPYSEIFHRPDFGSASAVAKELRWLMRSGDELKVFVVGPGMDEVPFLVKSPKAEFVDVIDQDPELHWFWPHLKKAANA